MQSVKIVTIGDTSVGKTSMLIAYTTNSFPGEYIPTVFDEYSANMMIDGRVFNVSLWDTNGSDEYDRLRPLSYAQTDFFLVLYSCASPFTFNRVAEKWMPEIQHLSPEARAIIVCTKTDLRENEEVIESVKKENNRGMVTTAEGEAMAATFGVRHMEISSIRIQGLKEMFDAAIVQAAGVATQRSLNAKKKCLIL